MKNHEIKSHLLRWGKAGLTALVSVFACRLVFYSPLLSLVSDSLEPDQTRLVMAAVSYLCCLLLPLVFFILFQEVDERKQRLAAAHPKMPKFLLLVRESSVSVDFWRNAIPMALLVTVFLPKNYLSLVRLSSFASSPILVFLNTLVAYTLPLMAFLLLGECFLRKDWFRQWRFSGFGYREDGAADIPDTSKKRLLFHIVCILASVYLLPSLMVYYQLASIAFKLVLQSGTLQSFVVFSFFIPSVKTVFEKRKFYGELKSHLGGIRGRFEQKTKLIRGFFGCSKRIDFVLETEKCMVLATMLPVRSKNASLLISDDLTYRFEKRIVAFYLSFFRHRIDFKGEIPEGKTVEKAVILTKEPKSIRFGNEDVSREVWSGDTVNDVKIYFASSFVSEMIRRENKSYRR